MEDRIKANAELVRRVALENMHVEVAYDLDGVRWLDGFIDRQRGEATDEVKRQLATTLGSYLGECIRHTYGGEWIQDPEYGWSVRINGGFSVFPFNKVQKQLADDEGESVLSLFTTIEPLLANAGMSAAPKRPWWKFW
ncbi:hypothetical protein ASE26_27380 [Duganella sp. Root198D2]|nr:hypothetical protein ASE26_27380 [Duganella sp. Root198D2]